MNDLRIPPHSIESEQSVLGALMVADCWDTVADKLSDLDFYRHEHRLIYSAICKLAESSKAVDVITVTQALETSGELEKIDGGMSYIGSLARQVPSAANVKHYAEIVRDKARERRFMAATMEISDISHGNAPIDAKIEKSIEIIQGMAEHGQNEPLELSKTLYKALEGIERRYASPDEISGLKTHFIDFDRKTCGLQNGDLIIIAGRPSMGKSALAVNIAENVAVMDGKPVAIFSLEMSDEQIALRNMASEGKININALRGGKLTDDDWPRLTHAMSKLSEAPIFIDSTPAITATQIHARCRRLKRRHNLSLVVIDYLQLMADEGENRVQEISAITRKLKLMARDLNIPVILLSQLSRKVEERSNKRPVMSDLRDSGAIEQDADVICMMYRDEYYNPDSPDKGIAELIIAKQRMGEVGTVYLTFRGEYSRFESYSGIISPRQMHTRKRGME